MLPYREPTWDLMCVLIYNVRDDPCYTNEDPGQSNMV